MIISCFKTACCELKWSARTIEILGPVGGQGLRRSTVAAYVEVGSPVFCYGCPPSRGSFLAGFAPTQPTSVVWRGGLRDHLVRRELMCLWLLIIGLPKFRNIWTAQGGGGSFQRQGTYRKGGCGVQLVRKWIDVRFKWSEIQVIWLWIDLRFNWFGCQSMCASNDFGCLLIRTSSEVVVNWFEIQMSWLSIDLRFKWFGCQMNWGSSGLVVNWCVIQIILSNEAFLRDFLQNWSFEDQKPSICARLPSKMKLRTSKTKHFCETSFKNDMLTARLTSELQYVLAIFKWMLQKYCACHEKVEPRHTKSCNCHAKGSLQSNTSVTWNLQPFHGFCVRGLNHRHRKARNPCPCHAKRIVSEPLQIPHACQRFCNPHELVRLPRILKPIEIPAPATRKALWTSKSGPRPWCFNDFDIQIVLARRRGANFWDFNFQKCSEPVSF